MSEQRLKLEVLELAAQTESLLNLYITAKRELHTAVGITVTNATEFPIVESVREQIKKVREGLGTL